MEGEKGLQNEKGGGGGDFFGPIFREARAGSRTEENFLQPMRNGLWDVPAP